MHVWEADEVRKLTLLNLSSLPHDESTSLVTLQCIMKQSIPSSGVKLFIVMFKSELWGVIIEVQLQIVDNVCLTLLRLDSKLSIPPSQSVHGVVLLSIL